MIKAAIFDIGGVLLNWTNLPLFEDIDQTLEITEEKRNEAWKTHLIPLEEGKIDEEEFWRSFIKDTDAHGTLPPESLLQRSFKKNFKINNDVLKIAHQLKTCGLSLGIISNMIEQHAEIIRATGLFNGFDDVILSNEVHLRKPKADIYKLAITNLGFSPDEIFFVDDLPENIKGAEKVGLYGIQFLNVEQLKDDIRKLGVDL
ncbi:HAD family phosphatase [soil metagenome]